MSAAEYKCLVRAIYEYPTCEVTGGPVHIIVEDYGVEDSTLDHSLSDIENHWSVVDAAPEDRAQIIALTRQIVDLLRPLPIAERDRIVRTQWW